MDGDAQLAAKKEAVDKICHTAGNGMRTRWRRWAPVTAGNIKKHYHREDKIWRRQFVLSHTER